MDEVAGSAAAMNPIDTAAAVATNRAAWDDIVPAHLKGYRMAEFVADPDACSEVVRIDAELLAPYLPSGSAQGLELCHLMCHIGQDSLSWARLGANVTGIDISDAAVAAANQAAAAAGLGEQARFVTAEVTQAAAVLGGTQFDVVYTSVGVLWWLSDLDAWAHTIAALLRPGGVFFLRDAHPMLSALDDQRTDDQLVVAYPYFDTGSAFADDAGLTYASPDGAGRRMYGWWHSLSEIIGALLGAGLRLVAFDEHQFVDWQAINALVEDAQGVYRLPEHPGRCPLSFSVVCTRD